METDDQLMPMPQSIYMHITPPALESEMRDIFHPKAAFSGCCICGAVFQSELDRKVYAGWATPQEQVQATIARRNWTQSHASTHSESEHKKLQASGRFCTPEAAHRLAAYGVVTLSDSSFSAEHADAQATAPRLPDTEPEAPTKPSISLNGVELTSPYFPLKSIKMEDK